MPIVTFLPSEKSVEVQEGTTLYDAASQAELPIASSCSANFICGKCVMQIVKGENALSSPTAAEKELLKREGHDAPNRISCRTALQGDCTVTTSYW